MAGRHGARGFTLIELMFVITIIGIIASIAITSYSKMAKRAKNAVVQENMHTVHLALEDFSVERLGVYPLPADEAALKALMNRGEYPNNPFTNAETAVVWNADPGAIGGIGIFNLPGGGYRLRGRGTQGLLTDVVVGD